MFQGVNVSRVMGIHIKASNKIYKLATQNAHISLPIYSYDFLKVWDGLSPGETKISELTGSTIPSPVASYGNTMFLNFLSDDSERKAGFKLQYYSGRNNFTFSFSARS